MSGTKRWTALLLTAAAMLAMAGCKTTVVEKDVPVTHDVVVPFRIIMTIIATTIIRRLLRIAVELKRHFSGFLRRNWAWLCPDCCE